MEGKVIKGPKSFYSKIEKSFGEFFFEQAGLLKDKVFQIDALSGKQETYWEVRKRCTAVAIHLQKLDCKSNDVVLVCCENNLDNIVPILATLFIGGCVSSVDPKQSEDDIENAIRVVEPKFIFVEEASLDFIKNSLKDSKCVPQIIVIGKSLTYIQLTDMEKTTSDEDRFVPVKRDLYSTALIMFSSGTTSLPKGISISHFAFLHGFLTFCEQGYCKPNVMIQIPSMFWISSIMVTALVLIKGGTKVLAPNIPAEHLLKVVEKYKGSFIFMSNIYSYEITDLEQRTIQKYDLSSLYSIMIGGSTVNPNHLLKFRNALPGTKITVGYGSTESGSIAAFDLKDEKAYREKLLSSGKVQCDVEIKIVDIESNQLKDLNQPGEIRIKSPYLMTGYYNSTKNDFDEDGFLKTGDVGYFDNDEYLYVTDRIHEVFKYKTNKISATAIEEVILQHPCVKEAIVFGVPHEMDRFHPGACVVLKESLNDPPSEKELLNFVNEKVADKNKLRAGLKIIEHITKTSTGKVQRRLTERETYIKELLK